MRALMNLDDVAGLAGSLGPDTRPEWLRVMPSAADSTAAYYRFFDAFVRRFGPLKAVEVGTYVGTSAAHLAYRNVGGAVVTIDTNPDAKCQIDRVAIEHGFIDRCHAITSDSMVALGHGGPPSEAVLRHAPYDVAFIDGNHTFNQGYGEYLAYRDLVRHGGLIFFDDTELDMSTRDMQKLWAAIGESKRALPGLHYTGFGVVQKDDAYVPETWESARGRLF